MSENLESLGVNLKLKEYWYQHFQNYQKSGLKKIDYVKKHQVSKNRFMYWSRKFELAASHQDSVDNFVAVKVKASEPKVGGYPVLCSIRLGNHQLLIHDVAALSSILQLGR